MSYLNSKMKIYCFNFQPKVEWTYIFCNKRYLSFIFCTKLRSYKPTYVQSKTYHFESWDQALYGIVVHLNETRCQMRNKLLNRVATNSEYGPNTKYRIPNIFVFENLTNTEYWIICFLKIDQIPNTNNEYWKLTDAHCH